jgi:hypothetical protein
MAAVWWESAAAPDRKSGHRRLAQSRGRQRSGLSKSPEALGSFGFSHRAPCVGFTRRPGFVRLQPRAGLLYPSRWVRSVGAAARVCSLEGSFTVTPGRSALPVARVRGFAPRAGLVRLSRPAGFVRGAAARVVRLRVEAACGAAAIGPTARSTMGILAHFRGSDHYDLAPRSRRREAGIRGRTVCEPPKGETWRADRSQMDLGFTPGAAHRPRKRQRPRSKAR